MLHSLSFVCRLDYGAFEHAKKIRNTDTQWYASTEPINSTILNSMIHTHNEHLIANKNVQTMYNLAYWWNIWKVAVMGSTLHYFDRSRFEDSVRRRATLTSF